MNNRAESLIVSKCQTPSIDENLFDSFQAAHLDRTATYTELSVTGERKSQAIEAFQRGEDVDLSAHQLSDERLQERLYALREWKEQLLSDNSIDADIKQIYRWRVNEDIAKLHILEASRSGDMRHFRRWNEFVYGKPDEDIYRASLDWVAHDAEVLLQKQNQDPAISQAAQTVLNLLEGERGYRELLIPEDEVFQQVRAHQFAPGGYFDQLLDGVDIPKDKKITPEIGNPILQHIITNNLKSDYGLRPSSSGSWSVNHAEKVVEYPENYSLSYERFVGLAAGHEIGQHYAEKVNGFLSVLQLLSSGLDRTEHGNEGTAMVREMSMYETFADFAKTPRWREIIRRGIGVGYGHGVGGIEPHTSQQTYALMNAIDTMYQTKLTPKDAEATAAKAHRKTGIFMVRTNRGVDGEQGGAFLKDKVYPEGHVKTWLTLATLGVKALDASLLGKYDINNPRHIKFLQDRGILPDNHVR